MLRKCFKYDFLSVFKIWWIAAVTVLGLSVLAGFGYRNRYLHYLDPDRYHLWENTAEGAYFFAIVAILILTTVLVAVRFYNNFFSDEGYLTFTLPVKRSTLFLSKILSGFVLSLMNVAVIIISVIITGIIIPASQPQYANAFIEFVVEFFGILQEVPKEDIGWLILYVFEITVISLLSSLVSLLLLYMLITIGATMAKKHKVAATVGLLVGFNYGMSALIIPAILAMSLWADATSHLFGAQLSDNEWLLFFAFIFLLFIGILTTVCALFGSITRGCIERKLNLS